MTRRNGWKTPAVLVVFVLAALLPGSLAVSQPPTSAPASQPASPRPVGQGKLDNGDGKPPFAFVVVGGTTYDSGEPMPAHVETVKLINRINPDFSVSVGDNVEGVRAVRAEWDAFEKVSADLLKPCFLIAGNHDTQKAGAEWARRFGPFYHAFVHKGAQFIMLCSDEPGKMGKLDDAQVKWLEETIAAAPAKVRFVFCHEGFWREGSKEMKDLWNGRIHPLFVKSGVAAVFGGHHAVYELREKDGVRYYITQGGGMHGATGKGKPPAPEKGGFQHVLKVAVGADHKAAVTLVGIDREEGDTIGLVARPAPKGPGKASQPANP